MTFHQFGTFYIVIVYILSSAIVLSFVITILDQNSWRTKEKIYTKRAEFRFEGLGHAQNMRSYIAIEMSYMIFLCLLRLGRAKFTMGGLDEGC